MKILQTNNAKANLIIFLKSLEKHPGTYLTGMCLFLEKHP